MSYSLREQEQELTIALRRPMAMVILVNLSAWIQQRTAGSDVNNTEPVYTANNVFNEAIDEMIIQHLTVTAVQKYFE